MAALYGLHMALVNEPKLKYNLLEQFKRGRDAFRVECNKLTSLLQHCHGHADDYVSFCQFTTSQPPSECFAFLVDVHADAKKVLEEVESVKREHDNRSRVPKGRTSLADRRLSQFPETASKALLPDGPQSLTASYIHLESMSASLTDIAAFWVDHVVHLAAISDKRTPLVRPEPELQKSMAAWARYQTVLLAAISSISESSDAAAVDPLKAGVSAPNASVVGAIQPPEVDALVPAALELYAYEYDIVNIMNIMIVYGQGEEEERVNRGGPNEERTAAVPIYISLDKDHV
ncbi:hypothetical protein MVEN_01551900 [Mycena venus]|uniref:Uncharacterized protein n=1 Tax=Mycena venus TaxID=2733690 RepID=A0A8H6XTQ8_9AGAR|nr:hypothetical protein MVEN_01551900 [Mycena venus]